MKSKRKILLTKREWVNYFSTSLYLLIPTIFFLYLAIEDSNEGNEIIPAIIFFFLSILIYWFNWTKLYFQEYKGILNNLEFKRAVEVTGKELDWQIEKMNENSAEAIRNPESLESGGERITIRRTKQSILINSIRNPNGFVTGYSAKRNKENTRRFLINAADVLKGENIEQLSNDRQKLKELEFWEESEWTIGKILMRITGYGLTLIFVLIGILSINQGEVGGYLAILFSIMISIVYIKTDIQILLEKYRRKRYKKPAHNTAESGHATVRLDKEGTEKEGSKLD